MIDGFALYTVISLAVFMMVFVGVVQHFKWRQYMLVGSFLLFLPTAFLAIIDILSHPRPVNLMWSFLYEDVDEADLVAHYMKEDEFIMVLLIWEGKPYPQWFRLPWNQEQAEQLQEAAEEAKRSGSPGLKVKKPFQDPSLEDRRHPWVNPAPTPSHEPPKREDTPEVFRFSHPSDA